MEKPQYVIVEVNSFSINKFTDRLIEIYIIRRTCDKVLATFSSTINPRYMVPVEVAKRTKIDQEAVRFQPVFCEVAEKLIDILEGAIIVSSEARHVYRILRSEFKTIGYKFNSGTLCTSKFVKNVLPRITNGNFKGQNKTSHYSTANLQSSAYKALVTEKELLNYIEDSKIDSHTTKSNTEIKYPNQYFERLQVDTIARKPGIYYFKDENDTILYIGKAVRLRDRIRSHFLSKLEKEKHLCSKTAKIDFEYTGSDLIAELYESEEIRLYQPLFNKAQKNYTNPFIIVSTVNKKGYIQLSIVRKDYSDSVREVFYNRLSVAKKLMDICGQFNLCPKYCGFHRIRGQCNHPMISGCPKACVNDVDVKEYNRRVKDAMAHLENNLKNFVIKLKGRTMNETGFVLVRDGVYNGFGFVDNCDQVTELEDFENFVLPKRHSYHTSRIIDSYITKPRNNANIINFGSYAESFKL